MKKILLLIFLLFVYHESMGQWDTLIIDISQSGVESGIAISHDRFIVGCDDSYTVFSLATVSFPSNKDGDCILDSLKIDSVIVMRITEQHSKEEVFYRKFADPDTVTFNGEYCFSISEVDKYQDFLYAKLSKGKAFSQEPIPNQSPFSFVIVDTIVGKHGEF